MKKAKLFLMLATYSLIPAFASAAWKMNTGAANGLPQDLNTVILNVINWILGFIALIAVLVIIWGGVQYLTSTGNESQANQGKDTIKYAVMGLAIAGLAYAIVNLIVGTVLVGTSSGSGDALMTRIIGLS